MLCLAVRWDLDGCGLFVYTGCWVCCAFDFCSDRLILGMLVWLVEPVIGLMGSYFL